MFQKTRPWWLGITLLFLLPQALHSQKSDSLCRWQLSGKVLDSAFHALEGAEVFLEEGRQRVFTDQNGRFAFRNLCSGNYHLHVSHQGESHADLELWLSGDTVLNLLLRHEELDLGTVHVHRIRRTGQASAAELQALAYRQGAAALAELEGVRLLQHGNSISKPMVQGMWGLRVPVFVNGAALEGQAWGMEHGPEMDVLGFQFAEVLQGIRALALGHDAIGGVLNLRVFRLPGKGPAICRHLRITSGTQAAANTAARPNCAFSASGIRIPSGSALLRTATAFSPDRMWVISAI